ncbi:hypothetical protein AQAU111925_00155 [Aquirufa aurantiipilula]
MVNGVIIVLLNQTINNITLFPVLQYFFFFKKRNKKTSFLVGQQRRISLRETVIHYAIAYIFDTNTHRLC